MTRALPVLVVLAATVVTAGRAEAQSLGTFSWQLQPFCNVVTVNINQQGAVYTADGYDNQCGAAQRAPLVGLGTPNPDGTIGFGLHVVTVPGGRSVHIDARITLPSLSGSWSDSAGNSRHLRLRREYGRQSTAGALDRRRDDDPVHVRPAAGRRVRGARHRRRSG